MCAYVVEHLMVLELATHDKLLKSELKPIWKPS